MEPRICPVCGTPQQWELWQRCACGYDFGPPPARRPDPTNSDEEKGNASSQDLTGKRLRYGVLFRRVLLGCLAFYGALGLVYGVLVAVRGLPPGETELPLASGSLTKTGWTSVEGNLNEEKLAQFEQDPFGMRAIDGVICALMIGFSGLWAGFQLGMLAVLGLWFWRMFSSDEAHQA